MASSVSKHVKRFHFRTSPRKCHFILSLNEVVHLTKLTLANPDDQCIIRKYNSTFFRQNNYTEKAKILYFLNLVYFLSLDGLWQNHVLYWPLTGLMWRNRTPFGKRVVNKYGSVSYYYRSFFHGTLHMWARIDEEHD